MYNFISYIKLISKLIMMTKKVNNLSMPTLLHELFFFFFYYYYNFEKDFHIFKIIGNHSQSVFIYKKKKFETVIW